MSGPNAGERIEIEHFSWQAESANARGRPG